MPVPRDISTASIGLAVGVSLIALFLGLRIWFERRAREAVLSTSDEGYFKNQDRRRSLGVVNILALAILIMYGSNIQPTLNDQARLRFLVVWLVVLSLLVSLLALALLDWLATRSYARRHRDDILKQQIESLRVQSKRVTSERTNRETNGHLSDKEDPTAD